MSRKLFCFIPLIALLAACETSSGSSSSSSGSSGSSSGSSGTSGSSGSPPPVSQVDGGADPTTGEVRFLSLGDSLTQGVGATDEKTGSWPALLSEKWRAKGCTVSLNNPAISGYTAEQIVTDQLPEVDTFKPTFITLQVGANDVANGVTLEAYRAAIKTILSTAKKSGARVVVMPQNEWFRSPLGKTYGPDSGEKRTQFDAALIEETKASGAEFVDLRLLFKQHADNNMWVSDGIHPTPEAYEQWASEVARVIPSPCGK